MSLLPTLFAKPYFYRQRETDSQQERKDLMQPTDPHSLPGKVQVQDFRKQKRLSAAHCYAKAVVGLDSCSASCQHLQVFLEAGHQTFLQNDSGKFCKVVQEWIEHLIYLMQQDTESAVKHPLFRAPMEAAQGRADGSGRWIGHQAAGAAHAHR